MKAILLGLLVVVRVGSGAWILQQGYEKLTGGFAVTGLIPVVAQSHDVPDWYKWFFAQIVAPNQAIFQWLIPLGEMAIGLGLLFGVLSKAASFFGVTLMLNYILADMIYTYPVQLFGFVVLLMAPQVGRILAMEPLLVGWWQRRTHGTYSHRR